MRSQQVENEDWLKILENDASAEEIRLSMISKLVLYLQTTYDFHTVSGEFDLSELERVIENLLHGAAQVAAWGLMTLDVPGEPIIIHEKNLFQTTKVFANILTSMGFPNEYIVFLRDPNLEKPAHASYEALFDTQRTFLNGETRALGVPRAKLRVIIPLNYYFDDWLGQRYPIVIANYLRAFEQAQQKKPDLENLLSLTNISLFFGMYHGLDSSANLRADSLQSVTENEKDILAQTAGQFVTVVRASEFSATVHFQQAERLITHILVHQFDLVAAYFAADIALYLTMEGKETTVKKPEPPALVSHDPTAPNLNPTNFGLLSKIIRSVLEQIEKLSRDKEKFANHYAQFISLILLNYGFQNPTPFFLDTIRRHREDAHLRVDLTHTKQKNMFDNYGIFLDKYVKQTYRIKKHGRDRGGEHNLLEEKSAPDATPVNNPSFILQQPAIKWNYISEEKLSSLQQNLFKRRSLPAQASALVQAVLQLSDEYLEVKETVPQLRL